MNADMDIDLVYLWVDGNDQAWQAKRNKLTGNTETRVDVNCKGRYADNDELKYSLRSIEKYAPWIRNIYIVTDNQTPRWLDTSHPKIHIVDHTDIMPPECLPCFNSCLIEHFIWRIPDLSEHFLYANDDMLLNKSVLPSDFFATDGLPIVRLRRRLFRRLSQWFKVHVMHKPLNTYILTIRHTLALVKQRYGIYFRGETHHNIDAYLKSTYQHTGEVFKAEIEATWRNHFRALNDIQRNIYSFVAMAEGVAHKRYVSRHTSFRIHTHRHINYDKFARYNPTFFCVNDSEHASDEDRRIAGEFLRKLFPDKSAFEK